MGLRYKETDALSVTLPKLLSADAAIQARLDKRPSRDGDKLCVATRNLQPLAVHGQLLCRLGRVHHGVSRVIVRHDCVENEDGNNSQ